MPGETVRPYLFIPLPSSSIISIDFLLLLRAFSSILVGLIAAGVNDYKYWITAHEMTDLTHVIIRKVRDQGEMRETRHERLHNCTGNLRITRQLYQQS